MPKATTEELYNLMSDVIEITSEQIKSDDPKIRMPAISNGMKILKNNHIKADPAANESLRNLAGDLKKSTEWGNLKEVPFLEDS